LICDHVQRLGARGESGVLAAGFATSPVDAALANGTLAHALDFDDINWRLHGHPSAALLPAVLALAETTGASGRDALLAYALGFEVECKVGRAVGLKHYERGWHGTSTCGVFAAAAAGSRLLGLDVRKTQHALGIAASHAGGLRQNFGTMTKPLHAGLAASAGVRAALLAQTGFTADDGIFEHRFGFLNVVGEDDRDPQALEQLGQPWELTDTGVYLKPYAACGCTHRTLDALYLLRQSEPVSFDDVEQVVCRVPYRVPMVLIHDDPQTGLEGKFSMQYCVSSFLLDGQLGVQQFRDEMVQRPEVRRLYPNVKIEVEPGASGEPQHDFADVTVKLRDGRELRWRAPAMGADARGPMNGPEIEAKFRNCAGLVLGLDEVEEVRRAVGVLEQLPDLRGLMSVACRTHGVWAERPVADPSRTSSPDTLQLAPEPRNTISAATSAGVDSRRLGVRAANT
jgi:2-methylcitrate dehydratase PrpD